MIWNLVGGTSKHSANGRWAICYFPSPGGWEVEDKTAPVGQRWTDKNFPTEAAAKAYAEGIENEGV